MQCCRSLFCERNSYNIDTEQFEYQLSKDKLQALALIAFIVGLAVLGDYVSQGVLIEDKIACYSLGIGINILTSVLLVVACYATYKAYNRNF